jgi:putative transposase
MTIANRSETLRLVQDCIVAGGNQVEACEILGVNLRSVQRYKSSTLIGDQRRGPVTVPFNKLSNFEREKIKRIAISLEFCDMTPHQIVPHLADRGEYVASESSFYRVLSQERLLNHRGRAKPRTVKKPLALMATGPNELYSWDITYLMSMVRGQYFYLYLFLDIFSRKIVGAEVHERESADTSSRLLTKICKSERVEKGKLTLHADNGGPMKGSTILVTMQWLGVMPSFSRPSVSNDNPYSESNFRTLKYCPMYPKKPFESIEVARAWVERFVLWYNTVHLHSGIKFVTPQSRHEGQDIEMLQKRELVYAKAQAANPSRWSGTTRNWSRIESVKLNWLKDDKDSATKGDQLAAS